MKQEHTKLLFLFPILIIILGFVAYANSLNGKFLYDDPILVENNKLIRAPSAVINFFTNDIFSGAAVGRKSSFYRPLQMASYTLNYSIGKLDVRGYHLVNTILHILVALSIYWLINILFSNHLLSLITALLFVVHPLHTEAVSYIAGRADSLVGLFMLLSFILYVKLINQTRINILKIIFLLLAYLCALFSKEYSLLLPLLLLFYHFVFGKKINITVFLSLLGVIAFYMVMRLTYLKPLLTLNTDTVADRLPGLFVAIFSYIKLLFLPFHLHFEYGQKLFAWTDLRTLGGVFITLLIFVWAYLKRGNKIILFSIGWFFLGLLPVSNLYKINYYMTEHFLYMPSIGFFLLLSYFLSLLYNNKYKIVALILMTCAVLFFLNLTIRQNDYWKDPLTFYTKTLELAPESSNAYTNLGQIYQDKGDLTKALSCYTKAIEFNPNNDKAYNNRGNLYNSNNNYDLSIPDLNKAVTLNPNYPEAYNNRGNAYNIKGDYVQALLDFNKAIELNPDYPEAYNNRGTTYNSKGNTSDAILNYNKAIELDPTIAKAYFNRANVYNKLRQYDQALLDYDRSIKLDPNFAEAYAKRGDTYNINGNYPQAILDYNKVIEINPKNATNYFNRGVAYDKEGNYTQALLDYNKTIELDSTLPNAYNTRGNLYLFQGNYAEAILDYNKTIELGLNDATIYFNRGIAYGKKGDYTQAILNYNKAIELKSDYLEAYNNRGNAYNMNGNYPEAILSFTKAIELAPNLTQGYGNRAIAYYNQMEFDKALNDLNKVQERGGKVNLELLEAVKKASVPPPQ